MNNTTQTPLIAVIFFFVAAFFHCYLVLDRIIAAVWAWYKFKDQSSGGHIMLSQETSIWFVFISLGLLVSGIVFFHENSSWRGRMIKFLQLVIFLNLTFYVVLMFSQLNEWRP